MAPTEQRTIDPKLLAERDELEAQRCEHGCLPGEYCEDCVYVPDLPCGADR